MKVLHCVQENTLHTNDNLSQEVREKMGILTEDMQRALTEQRLIFVATVCPDGTPNLSPKGTVMVWDDDHILFTDLASPGTMGNLASNPAVEINTIHPLARKGYRFKGTATIHNGDEVHAAAVSRMRNGLETLQRLADQVRAVALIRVEQAAPLISPGYWGGASEAEMRRDWEAYWSGVNAEWRAEQDVAPAATS